MYSNLEKNIKQNFNSDVLVITLNYYTVLYHISSNKHPHSNKPQLPRQNKHPSWISTPSLPNTFFTVAIKKILVLTTFLWDYGMLDYQEEDNL